jgi:hypothetical protein
MQVGGFGDYDQFTFRSIAPYGGVISFDELEVSHVLGVGVDVGEQQTSLNDRF